MLNTSDPGLKWMLALMLLIARMRKAEYNTTPLTFTWRGIRPCRLRTTWHWDADQDCWHARTKMNRTDTLLDTCHTDHAEYFKTFQPINPSIWINQSTSPKLQLGINHIKSSVLEWTTHWWICSHIFWS